MRLGLRRSLLLGMFSLFSATASAAATDTDPAGSCRCPEGYVPIDGGCCPACVFLDPPCALPCLICQEACGQTADGCDYSVGLTVTDER